MCHSFLGPSRMMPLHRVYCSLSEPLSSQVSAAQHHDCMAGQALKVKCKTRPTTASASVTGVFDTRLSAAWSLSRKEGPNSVCVATVLAKKLREMGITYRAGLFFPRERPCCAYSHQHLQNSVPPCRSPTTCPLSRGAGGRWRWCIGASGWRLGLARRRQRAGPRRR